MKEGAVCNLPMPQIVVSGDVLTMGSPVGCLVCSDFACGHISCMCKVKKKYTERVTVCAFHFQVLAHGIENQIPSLFDRI